MVVTMTVVMIRVDEVGKPPTLLSVHRESWSYWTVQFVSIHVRTQFMSLFLIYRNQEAENKGLES